MIGKEQHSVQNLKNVRQASPLPHTLHAVHGSKAPGDDAPEVKAGSVITRPTESLGGTSKEKDGTPTTQAEGLTGPGCARI